MCIFTNKFQQSNKMSKKNLNKRKNFLFNKNSLFFNVLLKILSLNILALLLPIFLK